MKKPIVEFQELLHVYIEDPTNKLIGDFMEWCMENDIYAEHVGGFSGGGIYAHSFSAEDGKKVREYLDPTPKETT